MAAMRKLLIAVVALLGALEVHSGRILVLSPLGSQSHRNVLSAFYSGLANRGHEIIVVASGKPSKPMKNVKEIIFSEELNLFGNISTIEVRKAGPMLWLKIDVSHVFSFCRRFYEHPEVKKLTDEKFDLVMNDAIATQCSLGLVHKTGAPLVTVVTSAVPNAIARHTGNYLPPSFVPDLSSPYTGEMNFRQRTMNLLYGYLTILLFGNGKSNMESIYREFMGQNTPSADEIVANASLVLVNAHLSFDSPKPLLPDVIEAGGAHCRPGKPLPKDLDDFISGAANGLILFSLGSIIKPQDLPEETRKLFVNVFSKLGQRVLWKWPLEMNDLPPNVKLSNWIPQQDVLAHPNTKLFMTHGGLLSTQEIIYHGVPAVYFPMFADQDKNSHHAAAIGIGKVLEILDLKESDLEETIKEVLRNPSYRQKVQELSTSFKDQPETPKQRATFWLEYVMRHKGALHLRSAARKLNFFQYHSLDSIAFIFSIGLTLLWLLKLAACKLLRKVWPRSSSNSTRESKKKN